MSNRIRSIIHKVHTYIYLNNCFSEKKCCIYEGVCVKSYFRTGMDNYAVLLLFCHEYHSNMLHVYSIIKYSDMLDLWKCYFAGLFFQNYFAK